MRRRQRLLKHRQRRHHQRVTAGPSPHSLARPPRDVRRLFVAGVLGVLSLVMLWEFISSVREMNQTREILARGVRTTATVVDSAHFRRFPDRLVVKFSTLRGEHVMARLSDSVDARDSPEGRLLEIRYDPDQPEHVIKAEITGLGHHFVLLPLVAGVGIGFAWGGVRLWRRK